MPTAEKERAADEQKETEARVSILYWAEARRRRDEAISRMEGLAYAPADQPDEAQNLIEDYKNASDEFETADQQLGQTRHISKPLRQEHEARIREAQERAGWHARQAGRSYDQVLGAQQDAERDRIMLENEQARLAVEARRGPMLTAPGTESSPPLTPVAGRTPEPGVVLEKFNAPVSADPFAASKPREGVDTHYQDASRAEGPAPGLATRTPAAAMTAGQHAEAAELQQREVRERGELLQEAERATANAIQGEHQQGGPAHGRVQNKEGGYKTERKGARPEPVPGEKEKP